MKRLAEFNIDAVPTITPAVLGQLAAGHYIDAGGAGRAARELRNRQIPSAHRAGAGCLRTGPAEESRYVTTTQLVNELVEAADVSSASWPATHAWTRSASDELGYVQIDSRGPNCSSRSSPNAKNSFGGDRHQPTLQRVGRSLPRPTPRRRAIVDRVTFNAPLSSRPAPSHTDYAPAKPPPGKTRQLNQGGAEIP